MKPTNQTDKLRQYIREEIKKQLSEANTEKLSALAELINRVGVFEKECKDAKAKILLQKAKKSLQDARTRYLYID